MLMQLGSLTFEVYPFNTDGYSRDAGADFAAKDIMGAMRPREFMGEGDETMGISGRIFPKKLGGLTGLDTLASMRKSGQAQILVRGDGKNLGWWLVEKVSERSSVLASDGIGRQIDFDISIVRTPKPAPASYIATLLRLFS